MHGKRRCPPRFYSLVKMGEEMSDKLVIEIWKKKDPDEITKELASPQSHLEAGSASAVTAAMAAAFVERTAAVCCENDADSERLAYILKNAGIIRGYMVHLVDEDIKSRGPMRQALKEGDERRIDATRQSAACIDAEIINMMVKLMDFAGELAEVCPKDKMHWLGEAAHLMMGAVECARVFVVNMADGSSDDTYRYVVRRENEITLEALRKVFDGIMEKVEAAI